MKVSLSHSLYTHDKDCEAARAALKQALVSFDIFEWLPNLSLPLARTTGRAVEQVHPKYLYKPSKTAKRFRQLSDEIPWVQQASDEVSTRFCLKRWVSACPSCYLSARFGYFDACSGAAHQGLGAKHGTCGKQLLVYNMDKPVAGKHADGAPNRCCNHPGHGIESPHSKDCRNLLLHLLNGSSAPSELLVYHLGTSKIQRSRKAPCNQPQRSAQDMQLQRLEAPSEVVFLQKSKPRQCQNRARMSTPRLEYPP